MHTKTDLAIVYKIQAIHTLRVNVRSLAQEARIIRQEMRRAGAEYRGALANHRRVTVRQEDAFGESQPAGNVEWAAIISWHDEGDGFRFLWYDESDRCYRQLKAPEWFRVDVNLETCRFEWPRCRHSELYGFLANPEAPIYP